MKNVYDNESFFNEYQTMRESEINANNLIENPIMKSMLPCLKGKTILDLGCGDGNMDKYFIKMGAKSVVATDISKNMIETASKVNFDENIEYKLLAMENLSSLNQKFDIVYSSLAFHYIEDFNKLIADIYCLLNNDGILIYSQESPINTSSIYYGEKPEKHIYKGEKRYILLSDYCNEGERNNYWNDIQVTKYHRTYATIVNTLINNKFKIEKLQDSFATDEAIKLVEKYKYQKDKPFFTFVRAKK